MGDGRTVYLFSYGTLRQEGVQIASFGRLLKGADDALPGYRRSMIEITDPDVIGKSGANLHPIVAASDDPTDEVPGTVFEITQAELAAADAYEVSDYKRVLARLKSGVDAWVYVKG
ncbi:MAG: gamma-glutamylcyclotransferase family protein [Roseiarcus sp.]|jgi:gamma-glutamylcyclotransferase (GGCT)/AIG2-like uncharacterized protein YtfP